MASGPKCCYLEPIPSAETAELRAAKSTRHPWGRTPSGRVVVVVVGSQAPGALLSPHGYLQPLWGEKQQMGEVGVGQNGWGEPWVGVG